MVATGIRGKFGTLMDSEGNIGSSWRGQVVQHSNKGAVIPGVFAWRGGRVVSQNGVGRGGMFGRLILKATSLDDLCDENGLSSFNEALIIFLGIYPKVRTYWPLRSKNEVFTKGQDNRFKDAVTFTEDQTVVDVDKDKTIVAYK